MRFFLRFNSKKLRFILKDYFSGKFINILRPQLKRTTTSMEDILNGRQPKRKTTSREEVLREEYLNGSQPLWKPYRKQMRLAGLANQFCTELGPGWPQLVSFVVMS